MGGNAGKVLVPIRDENSFIFYRRLQNAHLRCTRKGHAANTKALKRQELRNQDYVCLLA